MKSFTFLLLAALGGLLGTPFSPRAFADDRADLAKVEQQVEAVAEKATPCVVALTHPERGSVASGSGSVIAPNGLILTAAHVVGEAKTVEVTFTDGRKAQAKVLGADYHHDVALALITETGQYPFLELAEKSRLSIGTMVVALGHPGGYDARRLPPVRFGRVFELGAERSIRTDCTLISGDSGGPLLDLEGKVIGVHSYVGPDISENDDAPAEAVQREWSRLIRGEKWGRDEAPTASRLRPEERAGLNVERFRSRVLREATKTNGRLQASPEELAAWLEQCGMNRAKIKAMDPLELVQFMARAMGSSAQLAPGIADEAALPKLSEAELGGLDLKRFRKRILADALQRGGRLEAGAPEIRRWMREDGMKPERVAALSDDEAMTWITKALEPVAQVVPDPPDESAGATVAVPPADEPLAAQDHQFLAAMRPALAGLRAGVVALTDGSRTLALGTVVRENGFILTKHSEIAKAKGLQVKFADGHQLPAVEVQQFGAHDLALVKVAATGLKPIIFAAPANELRRGELLFTPGPDDENPLVAEGVVSVLERSLQEKGAFLGVGLRDVHEAIVISEVSPNTPASAAGLLRNDQILSLNDTSFHQTRELVEWVRSQEPESLIRLRFRRDGEERSAEVKLAQRPTPLSSAPTLGAEVSLIRSGYPLVFQHDQPLRASECGGVVLNLQGEVVGVNVSRAGRVDTYAVPAKTVAGLLEKPDYQALEEKAAAAAAALVKSI